MSKLLIVRHSVEDGIVMQDTGMREEGLRVSITMSECPVVCRK